MCVFIRMGCSSAETFADINQHNMASTISITKEDGFITYAVSPETAKAIFCYGDIPIFRLYDDGAEGMVESYEDLESSIESGVTLGVCIGFLDDIIRAAYAKDDMDKGRNYYSL